MQAWDQADLLLLQTVRQEDLSGRVLVLNDQFGALTVALQRFQPVLWSDSEISRLAAVHNLDLNGDTTLDFVPGHATPSGLFDLVVAKVPKSLALWQQQLTQLRGLLKPQCRVLASGMTKHLPNAAYDLMETCLGRAERHLAVKKARILEGRLDPSVSTEDLAMKEYRYRGMTLINLPNLFSRGKVDPGTDLLISTLDEMDSKKRVLDLACGNGLIGLYLQKTMPRAEVTFIDESYQAVESARRNFQRLYDTEAEFLVADGLIDYSGPGFDLVTLNPPFHQEHTVGDSTAWRLLQHTYRHLNTNGELRLVGNRHLAYHAKLKKIFGNCEVVDSNRKFVVLRAVKPA